MKVNLSLYQLDILKTLFWFRFGYSYISFHKRLAGVSNTIEETILKFVFENISFEIADAYQTLLGTYFAAAAINESRMFARVPHDDCYIAVIYVKSIENEEQVTFQHIPVTSHHVFTQDRTISLSQRDPKCT